MENMEENSEMIWKISKKSRLNCEMICPFPAILFSFSVSYNLIIFYELALSLVICPFPALLFS
jgi:hypothetical protein